VRPGSAREQGEVVLEGRRRDERMDRADRSALLRERFVDLARLIRWMISEKLSPGFFSLARRS
jgi:hypothetical protein